MYEYEYEVKMKTQVLAGSKQEIAERFARIDGDIREAIVFIQEPTDSPSPGEDVFAEMEPFTVKQGAANYSREAVYGRVEGE
jgi:hypothetical protein